MPIARTLLLTSSVLLLSCFTTGSAGAQPTKLDPRELAIGEIAYHTDTATLREILGPPARVADGSWFWPGIEVSVERGRVHQIRLTNDTRATSRGLRVGDSAERVRRLYGESCVAAALIYCVSVDPLDGFDERGIAVILDASGRVAQIYLGAVFTT